MNPITAIFSAIASVFLEGRRASEERKQADPQGRAYEKWLAQYGYEAQYQAYVKAHNGSNEGFVYQDPGDMPGGWGQ